MQDRFQFRVWDKYTHETPAEQMQFLCFNGCLVDSDGCHHSPDDYIVEQCTGLKDKNGKLIFEGDLIKSPNNSHPLAVYHDITGLWRCKENRPNGIWELPLYDMVRNYTVEIIGNIHEPREEKQ